MIDKAYVLGALNKSTSESKYIKSTQPNYMSVPNYEFSQQQEKEIVQTFDKFYNQGIDHAAATIKTIWVHSDPEIFPTHLYEKIISELEKLKHSGESKNVKNV